eukprot:CAMPEP_0117571766 /NCGR_PEP_ID=MMETSP0784-20121206/59948_1 /TAXON_ID=39447 /ORGANISM="" /LENGTH=159 /DNA_ID=CAMNT_0005369991 /DNA_START=73 /DNA_END=549 /DNA_ORIENTATION=-
MPAMPSGPPSRYVLGKRPWLCTLLVVQTAFCVLRFFLLLDIMGGFIMTICVAVGWYGYCQDMQLMYICYWGMMGLFNGVLELVRLLDMVVHSPSPMFSSELPALTNFAHFVVLGSPVSLIAGAALAYMLYQHHDDAPVAVNSGRGGLWQQPSTFQTFGG